MLVKQILKDKAAGEVTTVTSAMTVAEAVAILSERRIGAVVVAEGEGRPEGILSERDVVREIGKRGPACLEETVASMMTRDPQVCGLDDDAVAVLETMTTGRFRHLPVVDGDAMIGLISIGDVVKARLSELSAEADALQGMIMGH